MMLINLITFQKYKNTKHLLTKIKSALFSTLFISLISTALTVQSSIASEQKASPEELTSEKIEEAVKGNISLSDFQKMIKSSINHNMLQTAYENLFLDMGLSNLFSSKINYLGERIEAIEKQQSSTASSSTSTVSSSTSAALSTSSITSAPLSTSSITTDNLNNNDNQNCSSSVDPLSKNARSIVSLLSSADPTNNFKDANNQQAMAGPINPGDRLSQLIDFGNQLSNFLKNARKETHGNVTSWVRNSSETENESYAPGGSNNRRGNLTTAEARELNALNNMNMDDMTPEQINRHKTLFNKNRG